MAIEDEARAEAWDEGYWQGINGHTGPGNPYRDSGETAPESTKYGPQTAEVEALLERARALTATDELELGAALGAAWYSARGAVSGAIRSAAAWGVARGAAWDAARSAARDAGRGVARDEMLDAAEYAAGGKRRDEMLDAVCALAARDLITPAGFTQAHYDLLTGPWRKVIGKVHSDDAPLTETESPA